MNPGDYDQTSTSSTSLPTSDRVHFQEQTCVKVSPAHTFIFLMTLTFLPQTSFSGDAGNDPLSTDCPEDLFYKVTLFSTKSNKFSGNVYACFEQDHYRVVCHNKTSEAYDKEAKKLCTSFGMQNQFISRIRLMNTELKQSFRARHLEEGNVFRKVFSYLFSKDYKADISVLTNALSDEQPAPEPYDTEKTAKSGSVSPDKQHESADFPESRRLSGPGQGDPADDEQPALRGSDSVIYAGAGIIAATAAWGTWHLTRGFPDEYRAEGGWKIAPKLLNSNADGPAVRVTEFAKISDIKMLSTETTVVAVAVHSLPGKSLPVPGQRLEYSGGIPAEIVTGDGLKAHLEVLYVSGDKTSVFLKPRLIKVKPFTDGLQKYLDKNGKLKESVVYADEGQSTLPPGWYTQRHISAEAGFDDSLQNAWEQKNSPYLFSLDFSNWAHNYQRDLPRYAMKWPVPTEENVEQIILTSEDHFQMWKWLVHARYSTPEKGHPWIKKNLPGKIRAAKKADAGYFLNHQPILTGKALTEWNNHKLQIMEAVLFEKFRNLPQSKERLIATNPHPIVQLKTDPIWGPGTDGHGQNLLGVALVNVRKAFMEGRNIQFRYEDLP